MNFLKLNVNKTEVMFIGSKTQSTIFSDLSLTLDGTVFTSANTVKTLGFIIDKNLTMNAQVKEVTRICYYHLKRLQRIRFCLDTPTRLLLVKSFILSKLDFNNAVLVGIAGGLVNKLQKVIDASARFIFNVKKRYDISEYLYKAHILPMHFRIIYKLCTTTYRNYFIKQLFPVLYERYGCTKEHYSSY